jgi:16S rRNA G966 N2-methylase RsmD
VNIYISPPFADLTDKLDDLLQAIQTLQSRVAEDSVIVVQSERGSPLDTAPLFETWERRQYGRNELVIWQREITADSNPQADDQFHDRA